MTAARSAPTTRQKAALRTPYKWVLAALVLAGPAAALLSQLRGETSPPLPAAHAAVTVTAVAVRATRWSEGFSASGAIEAWQEAIVGSQSSGLRLADVRVNVGDVVAHGQVLARFDDAMLRAEERQLVAAVAQAEATAAQAEANKQRALRLRDSGAISEQDILQNVTTADVARAGVASARAQLASKRLQLAYTDVRAPDNGVISARTATLGAVVGTGEELFRLVRQGRLEWRAELSAEQLLQTSPGQRIHLRLPDGNPAQARIRQTAPALDPGSRLGVAYAELLPGSSARAGMYATGRVLLQDKPALVVPAASVFIRDGRSYVARLDDAASLAKVRLLAVDVGRRQGGELELLGDVEQGDRVVVQGAGFLDDGDLVRVVVTAATSAGASP